MVGNFFCLCKKKLTVNNLIKLRSKKNLSGDFIKSAAVLIAERPPPLSKRTQVCTWN